ncbi:hypothetical protein D1AOALGA4SA_789 [Olavius algarvensis Delta 1 endosymbiont]|nr:hypothetical protein D1AOALGA4SA_789 [Olavius algarvensis Delta 1 endosymbiont]
MPELKIEYFWFASTRLSSTQVGGSILFCRYQKKAKIRLTVTQP